MVCLLRSFVVGRRAGRGADIQEVAASAFTVPALSPHHSQMASRPICDACAHAPPMRQAMCEKPRAPVDGQCDESQCDWILNSEKTLGVTWRGGHGAARGWGNSVGYIRNIHEVAAMLGRRLLVKPVNAYLPTAHLKLGGRLPWNVPEGGLQSAVVINDSMAEPFVAPRGFKGLEHAANRTLVKWALVSYLARFNNATQLWLDFSHPAMYMLLKGAPCSGARHMGDFANCMGRLMTTPVGELAQRQSTLRSTLARMGTLVIKSSNAESGTLNANLHRRLNDVRGNDASGGLFVSAKGSGQSEDGSSSSKDSADASSASSIDLGGDGSSGIGGHGRYIGVHVRTFGADMNIPRGTKPLSAIALQFLAWEVQVNASEYLSAIRKLCRNGTLPLYVASDSRAAIGVFEAACPGRVLHQYHPSVRAGRAGLGTGVGVELQPSGPVHSERLRRNASAAGSTDLLLDWLMLAGAHAVVRWGAQHSSFASSARLRSCSGRLWRSPKSWKYKAATSWLLGKLRFHANKVRANASYDCAATISPMLRTIPTCENGCVVSCLGNVYSGFA